MTGSVRTHQTPVGATTLPQDERKHTRPCQVRVSTSGWLSGSGNIDNRIQGGEAGGVPAILAILSIYAPHISHTMIFDCSRGD